MLRTPFPGGSYIDALPDGSYAVLHVHSHIETHLGNIALPPGESFGLMFLRCTAMHGFRFVGRLHDTNSPRLREWAGQWSDPIPTATGYAVYNGAGEILDTLPAGYQFVGDDGQPVTRLHAYPPQDGIPIANWTDTAGIRIGQGEPGGGVRVFVDGVLRELEPGDCSFVNVNRDGERVAISFWKSVENCAVMVQTTLPELRTLRPVVVPAPDKETPVQLQKCEVTVERFTLTPAAKIPDGVVAEFYDRMNEQGAHVRIWVEGGSMRFSIDYPGAGPGLKGETGARRPVR